MIAAKTASSEEGSRAAAALLGGLWTSVTTAENRRQLIKTKELSSKAAWRHLRGQTDRELTRKQQHTSQDVKAANLVGGLELIQLHLSRLAVGLIINHLSNT